MASNEDEERIRRLEERVARLERLAGASEAGAQGEPLEEAATEVVEEPAPAPPPAASAPTRTLEERLGGDLLAKAGMIVLVLGVVFFLNYAFENDWIGLTERIVLGVVAGTAMVVGGDLLLRRDYGVYAQVLAGGGAAIVYFALFAAYQFPEYRAATGVTLELDAVLLGLTAIGFGAYATWRRTPVLASGAVGLVGMTALVAEAWSAFSVPYLVLAAGAGAGAATWRRWPAVVVWTVLAAYGALAGLLAMEVDPTTVSWGAVALLAALTTAGLRLPDRDADPFSLAVAATALTIAGAWGVLMLAATLDERETWRGPLTLALAGAAIALAALAPVGRQARMGWGAAGAVLALAWPPIHFDGLDTVVAWAALALAGALAQWRWRTGLLRPALVAAAVLLAAHLSTFEAPRLNDGRVDTLLSTLVFLGAVVSLVVAWRSEARAYHPDEPTSRLFLGLALYVPLVYAAAAFEGWWITLSWAVEGLLLLAVGFTLDLRDVRLGSLAVFGLVLGRVFLVDLAGLEVVYRIVTFLVVGAILLVASFVFARAQRSRGD